MSSGESTTSVGGLRRRGVNATWPLARLAVDDRGIMAGIRGRVLRRFGVAWSWTDIDRVELARHVMTGRAVGVAFYGRGRLVFWCWASVCDQIIEEVRRYAPDKLVRPGRTRVVAGFVLTRGE